MADLRAWNLHPRGVNERWTETTDTDNDVSSAVDTFTQDRAVTARANDLDNRTARYRLFSETGAREDPGAYIL